MPVDSSEQRTSNPRITRLDISEMPPYHTSGSGSPVVGIAPDASAMLRIDCPTRIVQQPMATSRVWLLRQRRATVSPSQATSIRNSSSSSEPMKPNSSANTA